VDPQERQTIGTAQRRGQHQKIAKPAKVDLYNSAYGHCAAEVCREIRWEAIELFWIPKS
jgi:hypothetical protein